MHTRREILAMTGAAALMSQRLSAQPIPDQLVLLGTGGGPTPKALRAAPSMALMIGGQLHVIDAGNGVARQVVLAGLPLKTLSHVWITHLHNDHVADAFTLPWLAWSGALTTPVTVHGPRGMQQMARDWLRFAHVDIATRMADEGRPDLRKMIRVAEVQPKGSGRIVLLDSAGLKVTAARVEHPPLTDSFAYRFDWAGKSVVWSGDTRPCPALIELARGADYLVQEVMYLPAMERLIQAESNAPSLRAHLLASHTPVEQAGELATAAGVKTLVLSHFVPGGDASVRDEDWRAAASRGFAGPIIVGRDLLRLAL
ncbi:MBL fold metallo-hydrolase [Sandarakinorhabdus oryzae]|uniref:MBL fold metallo-hydrolase n=1 Tax=Sandarakinorhabdus oryzae TaxID=2675220 RepID=UPI0012E294D1|nr:MBL fold metallo-hydrolase [Sandarakinorhabdus oryzae]